MAFMRPIHPDGGGIVPQSWGLSRHRTRLSFFKGGCEAVDSNFDLAGRHICTSQVAFSRCLTPLFLMLASAGSFDAFMSLLCGFHYRKDFYICIDGRDCHFACLVQHLERKSA